MALRLIAEPRGQPVTDGDNEHVLVADDRTTDVNEHVLVAHDIDDGYSTGDNEHVLVADDRTTDVNEHVLVAHDIDDGYSTGDNEHVLAAVHDDTGRPAGHDGGRAGTGRPAGHDRGCAGTGDLAGHDRRRAGAGRLTGTGDLARDHRHLVPDTAPRHQSDHYRYGPVTGADFADPDRLGRHAEPDAPDQSHR